MTRPGTTPCETPTSLEALTGPADGALALPMRTSGGPGATVDLSTQDGVRWAYELLVREGTRRQQEELLNADLLRLIWSKLRLPQRCRDLWQLRFPELALVDGVAIKHPPEQPQRRPDHPPPGFHI
jgi:hypothetical protein